MENRFRPRRHGNRWRIRWTDERGARRSEVYADKDEARLALRRHVLDVEEVKNGHRAASPPSKTFGELCDRWLHDRVDKRSLKTDEGVIERHLRPHFGQLKLVEIAEANVMAYRTAVAEYVIDTTVYKNLTVFSSLLHYAHRLGWLHRVPYFKKPKVKQQDLDFRYLKTDDEVARFLGAAQQEGVDVHALYCAALYTGMRIGELAGLLWEDVDLDRRLIRVRRSYAGPTKGDDTRHVPILDPLLSMLRAWRTRNTFDLVFPGRAGTMLYHSAHVVDGVLKRVLDRAGFPSTQKRARVMAYDFEREHGRIKRDANGRTLRRPGRLVDVVKVEPYITFHGLRHTFASHWVMKGGDLFKLQKILGHKNVQVTLRYAHLAPEAFSGDWTRLGSVSPVPTVLEFPHQRKRCPMTTRGTAGREDAL
jgi:integrase